MNTKSKGREISLDIEVWKFDILVGVKYLDTQQYEFKWGKEALELLTRIREKNMQVISFNGNHYDLPILYNYYFNPKNQASFFELSKYIVEDHIPIYMPNDFFNSIDLFELLSQVSKVGLKVIEAILGWEIRETTIDFRYEYKLTEEQKREAEHYNKQDLDAAEELYKHLLPYIQLRIRLAEFLNIPHNYSVPLPTMMGAGLGAHRQLHPRIPLHPSVYTIPIKHEVKDIMIKHMEGNKPGLNYTFEMGGVSYTVGDGGIHSNRDNVVANNVFHVDVKGYYTLLQLLFDLFSRNIPKEGIETILFMYFRRLKMKNSDFSDMPKVLKDKIHNDYPKVYEYVFFGHEEEDKVTAGALKIGVLSIWGAMRNWAHILFDPDVGFLVTLYGQLFLLALIEKFAGNGIDILNANTDGLIVQGDEELIRKLTKEWQEYGFDVEINKYKRFVAKDVNNYILGNKFDKLTFKGRNFSALRPWLISNMITVPQTPVIGKILSELLFYGEEELGDPEEYVRKRIKSDDFKPMDFMFIINHTYKYSGMAYVETSEELQKVNRVYASKNGSTVYKYKGEFGKQNYISVSMPNKSKSVLISELNKEIYEDLMQLYNSEPILKTRNQLYQLIETETVTADGKKLNYKIAEYQYKYPGLPLVKMCNQDMNTVTFKGLDIDYDYYIEQILSLFVTYHLG